MTFSEQPGSSNNPFESLSRSDLLETLKNITDYGEGELNNFYIAVRNWNTSLDQAKNLGMLEFVDKVQAKIDRAQEYINKYKEVLSDLKNLNPHSLSTAEIRFVINKFVTELSVMNALKAKVITG